MTAKGAMMVGERNCSEPPDEDKNGLRYKLMAKGYYISDCFGTLIQGWLPHQDQWICLGEPGEPCRRLENSKWGWGEGDGKKVWR